MQAHKLASSRDVSPATAETAFRMKISGPKQGLEDQRQKEDEPEHGAAKDGGPAKLRGQLRASGIGVLKGQMSCVGPVRGPGAGRIFK